MQSVAVRCPHCGKPNLIPSIAAGTALRCPFCGAAYLAPPLPATPSSNAAYNAPATTFIPPHLVQAATTTTPLPAASIESASIDGAQGPSLRSPTRGRKVIAIAYAVVLLTLLGVLAVTAGSIVVALNRMQPTTVQVVSDPAHPASAPVPPTWTSAEKPVVREDVRVTIINIEYGPALGWNSSNEPTESSSGDFLHVYLRIDNRGNRRLKYTSWYGARFQDGGRQVAAKLIDSSDHAWPQQQFTDLERIRGQTPQIEMSKGDRTDDVLIFAIPRAVYASGKPLRLALPAGAISRKIGGQWHAQAGFYRFEIPASMLTGEPISQP